ncbi:MAG: thioredoxin domain-containing protein [Myxococcota bacterium]
MPESDGHPTKESTNEPATGPSPNRLAGESSAYLRQHMNNPVDWYPWGPEARERAQREDKPLLVSIGYSACHWCHVMEHESFEDPETAALMNRFFVSIKVDREERPDVDQIYMKALVSLTGHGGWPMTVFCTPDAEPFYAGTYFPPEPRHGLPSFRQLLEGIARTYRSQRGQVASAAARILESLQMKPGGEAGETPGAATAAHGAMQLLQRADPDHGGFGGAPKFPTPSSLELLLAAADVLPERKAREALAHVTLTCREMSRGGLYDHLAGGFHRYSVDDRWAIPHFEKMLYDQGQLLRLYAETWRRCGGGDDDLVWPIRETAQYLRRQMTAPEGGFYASEDADSEGQEGRFYVWTPDQVEAALGADAAREFCATYGVTEDGNFEGGATVLHDVSREARARLAKQRESLRRVREKRVAPGVDRKRVAAWNGFTISGLARAGSLLGDASMLGDAAAAADFVFDRMQDADGRLHRVFNAGRASVPAFLDDLAAMLEACLDLYRAGAGDRFLTSATQLANDIARRFFDDTESDLFFTPIDGEPLVHRPRSDGDGATPDSTGLAVLGLLRMATLAGREDLRQLVDRVIRTHARMLERAPEGLPTLARAALAADWGISVAVVVGNPDDATTHALADRARRVLLPEDCVLVVAPGAQLPEGVDPSWLTGRGAVKSRATAYVCRGVTCSLPAFTPDELVPLERPTATA